MDGMSLGSAARSERVWIAICAINMICVRTDQLLGVAALSSILVFIAATLWS